MKKFLSNFAIFIAPLILLAAPVDYFLSKNLRNATTFASKEMPVWNDMFGGKINSDVIVMGSSRAWVHFDPMMIQDSLYTTAYNLGADGQNFQMQEARYRILIRNNKRPRLIIQSIDIFTLNKKTEMFNADQLLPYMLWDKDLKKTVLKFDGFSQWDFLIPLVRFYGKRDALKMALKMMFIHQPDKPERIRGYQGQNDVWTDEFENAQKAIGKYRALTDTSTINLFRTYLADCKAHGTDLIFVYAPEYIKGQEFVQNRAEIIQLYRDLGKEFSIPIFDFSNDPMSYQREYFYNSEHMNKTGAEKFTHQLIDSIRKYDLMPKR